VVFGSGFGSSFGTLFVNVIKAPMTIIVADNPTDNPINDIASAQTMINNQPNYHTAYTI